MAKKAPLEQAPDSPPTPNPSNALSAQSGAEELRRLSHILQLSGTMVMYAEVSAPNGWRALDDAQLAEKVVWQARFRDERAAQAVLPLNVLPGKAYYDSWVEAKEPDDRAPMSAVSNGAFRADAGSWKQEFRARDRHGRLHWFSQVATVERMSENSWRVTTLNTDITSLKQAEAERRDHVRFLEGLDRVNQAMQRSSDSQLKSSVLDALLSVFDCDRARLVEPCDPNASTWRVAIERAKPGKVAETVVSGDVAQVMKRLCDSDGPQAFGHGHESDVPSGMQSSLSVKSLLAMILRPRGGRSYMLALHQCDVTRVWSTADIRLFREIGDRLEVGLTSLFAHWALVASERKLEHAQQIAHVGYWERAHDFEDAQWSTETFRIFGLPPAARAPSLEEFFKLIHPEDRESVQRAIQGAQSGEPYEVEYRILHPNGNFRYVRSRGEALRDGSGGPQRFFGTVQDISERKAAELKIREREREIRALADNSPDFILRYTRDCRIIYANEAIAKAMGVPASAFLNVALGSASQATGRGMSGEGLEQVRRAVLEVFATGIPKEIDVTAVMASGERFLNVRFVPEQDASGEVASVLSTSRDFTAQKRAEQALRESEALFRQVTETIEEVFWLFDSGTGHTLYVSPAYEKIWGRSCSSLYESPRSWLDYVHPDDRERVRGSLGDQTTEGYQVEYRIVRPDGQERWIEDRGFPIRDPDGQTRRVAGLAIDITAQKRLEVQFRQAQKMDAVGRLAGGIAHDFNNLLTVVQMHGSLLLADATLAGETAEAVRTILQATDRAAGLTRQLLSFSRQQTKHARPLDMAEVVGNMTKLLRRLLGEDISLQAHFAAGLPPVFADPGMLEQVLMNLAVNARDAMPEGGVLTLSLDDRRIDRGDEPSQPGARAGRFVRLSVADTGCGISADSKEHIFEPFFTTKEPGKGTGLGLATVFGIVEQHNGWIEVESAVGKGSTFSVFLPAIEGSAALPRPSQFSKTDARGGSELILLVEDEAEVRAAAANALRRSGYSVLEACNAAEATRQWEQYRGRIALLITDIVMPGGQNGEKLAIDLRREDRSLRVMLTSGYPQARGQTPLFATAEKFLPKPYGVADLLQAVRQSLDEPSDEARVG